MFPSSKLATLCRASVFAAVSVTAISAAPAPKPRASAPIPPRLRTALAAIQPSLLKGDLSFLASDALAGRYTPSPGLDVAAEFIASQFRAAGLEPGGNQDYFQVASMIERKPPKPLKPLEVTDESGSYTVPADLLMFNSASHAANITKSSVLVLKAQDPALLQEQTISGKTIVAPVVNLAALKGQEQLDAYNKMQAFQSVVTDSDAQLLLLVGRGRPVGARLVEDSPKLQNKVPIVTADSNRLSEWFKEDGSEKRSVSLEVAAPIDQKVQLKNVIGILRGSDPVLKDTCVLLTAHYDHIGTLETGRALSNSKEPDAKDKIFNGANDDGSGTVSVIEVARALATLKPRPKRTIVFMTFFGEERGLIGSTYYGRHPVFPVAKTIADLNLEQVGRTDSSEGSQVNTASLTGYDYSDVPGYLERAGRLTGVKVYLEKGASDEYFVRSDNAALALQGVPAHTLTVAFEYPDYHDLRDEWQKIDYDNMARVDRTVALALLNIANNPIAPKWNAKNPKTNDFRQAQAKLRP